MRTGWARLEQGPLRRLQFVDNNTDVDKTRNALKLKPVFQLSAPRGDYAQKRDRDGMGRLIVVLF